MQGAGRLLLGAAGVAADAAELRPRADARPQAVWELRLSHWTGELPVLTIDTDWAWHQWDHLFGTFTYAGQPVFGFKSTPSGEPLDTFGRNIYVDTFNSAYGTGWKRENSFLTHTSTGAFCYASTRTARSRPARERSTARRSKGPASRPT